MEEDPVKARRLAALCRRMGTLWSDKIIKTVDEEIPEVKLRECQLTLLGKLFSRPNVNFQAFHSTMRKAWKVAEVACQMISPGLFTFTFRSAVDKQKVLAASPWSFSGNLLILQQLNPLFPVHCHEFSSCAFWVHVHGLPLARITEKIMKETVSSLGECLELKIATKEGSPCKVGKARVMVKLNDPLLPGMLMNVGSDQVWVDFKYERLPHYCYSCGRIGHFATACLEIPYIEADYETIIPGNFGHWLRVEERDHSPFWKLYYEADMSSQSEEESVPESPLQNTPEGPFGPGLVNNLGQTTKNMSLITGSSYLDKGKAMDDAIMGDRTYQDTQLLLANSPWQDVIQQQDAGPAKCSRKMSKGMMARKKRRHVPYLTIENEPEILDESQLRETPIRVMQGDDLWALVAGPNKPPGEP